MKNVLNILVFILLCNLSFGQSLIKNGGFERKRFHIHIHIFSDVQDAKFWTNPNRASPDIHKNNHVDKLLQLELGESHPDSGSYYVGITFSREPYEYYEYIETKLKEKLKPNKLYCFEIKVLFDSKANYCVDNLQFALTKKYIRGNKRKPLVAENIIKLSNGLLLNNPIKYSSLSSIYFAKGNEKYLTIGQFNGDVKYYNIEYIKKRPPYEIMAPYYYLDNVILKEIKDSAECPCYAGIVKSQIKYDTIKFNEITISKNHQNIVYTLSQVKFKTNVFLLQSSDYPELDSIVTVLKNDTLLKVLVSGHTDITGNFIKNFGLSEKRAKSVADYLIKGGVSENRVKFEGYGSSNPVASNDTEQGRAINRRVEIIFE